MKVFETNLKVSMSFVVGLFLLLFLVVSLIACFSIDDPSNRWCTISGGLAAGLTVAIIQFVIAWQDYKQTDKLSKLELLDILYRRDNRSFYANYIKDSTKEIKIMGVTAFRFFNDFADSTPNASEDSKALLIALSKSVHVKILLPSIECLDSERKQQNAKIVSEKITEIKKKYENLEVRYFNHIPAHSIFSVDDTCIVGPVFPNLESKNTPALYLRNTSPIAIEHIKYFDKEWEELNEQN